MSDPEALRREMYAEAAESGVRREAVGMLSGTRHVGAPETSYSHYSRPMMREAYARLDAEREGCKFAPERDPCFNCGVRRDLHDDAGCKRWRAA